MNNRMVNAAILVAVVVFLSVLALRVKIRATADSVAILKTSGMTCGSCSDKIANALQSVEGVAATEVDVEGGRVFVGYDSQVVKPATLVGKIGGVGFESKVQMVLTPEQFRQMTGRTIGQGAMRCGCGDWRQ